MADAAFFYACNGALMSIFGGNTAILSPQRASFLHSSKALQLLDTVASLSNVLPLSPGLRNSQSASSGHGEINAQFLVLLANTALRVIQELTRKGCHRNSVCCAKLRVGRRISACPSVSRASRSCRADPVLASTGCMQATLCCAQERASRSQGCIIGAGDGKRFHGSPAVRADYRMNSVTPLHHLCSCNVPRKPLTIVVLPPDSVCISKSRCCSVSLFSSVLFLPT